MFRIQLKEGIDPEKESKNFEKYYKEGYFVSEAFLEEWAENLNKDATIVPDMKRPVKIQTLKEWFPNMTEMGTFDMDIYFSRATQEEMEAVKNYIVENYPKIAWIKGGERMMQELENPVDAVAIFKGLEKPYVPPEKLPESEQKIHKEGEGVLLCKTWGLKDSWVTYGHVKEPVYLKDRVYVDNAYNELAHDKEGRGTLLIPCRPLHLGHEWASKVVEKMWEMGIREHPHYLEAKLYDTIDLEDKENQKIISEEYQEYYSAEELCKKLGDELRWYNSVTKDKLYFNSVNSKELTSDRIRKGRELYKRMIAHANILLKSFKGSKKELLDVMAREGILSEGWIDLRDRRC